MSVNQYLKNKLKKYFDLYFYSFDLLIFRNIIITGVFSK